MRNTRLKWTEGPIHAMIGDTEILIAKYLFAFITYSEL